MNGDGTASTKPVLELIEEKLKNVEYYKTEIVPLVDRNSDENAEKYVDMLRDLYENGKRPLVADIVGSLLKADIFGQKSYTHPLFLHFVAEIIADNLYTNLPGQEPKTLRVRERKALEEAYPLFRRAELEKVAGAKVKIKEYIQARYGIEPRKFDRMMRDYRSIKRQDEIFEEFEQDLPPVDW